MTYFIIYKEDQLLINRENNKFLLPTSNDFDQAPLHNYSKTKLHTGSDHTYYFVDVDDQFHGPNDYDFLSMRDCRDYHKEHHYPHIARAYQLLNWSRQHKYCGVCGHAFNDFGHEYAKKCPNCGHILFPQTSNAVITGIIKDNQLLLAHNKNFPEDLYSLIAGFVELGETFEEAVARETFEEVGLRVKNIRYFGSQPWPFPNSTMVGFLADYDSGEITPDGFEIIDAHWYTPDNFPLIPNAYSIASKIIEHYRNHIYKG